MAGPALSTTVLQLHEACILVWKEYNHNHLIFALFFFKCMCFYHSVATNIEIDLLEVLDLHQVANVFLMKMQARPLCVKVCIKPVNLIVLACEKY